MDLSGHEGDIIPIQMTNSYVVHGHGHSNSSRPPPPPPPPTTLSATNDMTDDQQQEQQVAVVVSSSSKKIVAAAKPVKYRECLKNHAASMGGNATDGCGEFMPGGEEGTLESFRCSACGCHRNFHRKEVEGADPINPSCLLDAAAAAYSYYHHLKARPTATYGGYVPRPTAALPPPPPPAALIMPLGVAMHTSESDEVEETGYGGGGVMAAGRGAAQAPTARKRFRTKFTQEQKEKMLVFADRVDWRLQRQEEGLVQHFCQEVGVKRRVLKVWMHNNKHNFAKKTTTTTTPLHLQQQQ